MMQFASVKSAVFLMGFVFLSLSGRAITPVEGFINRMRTSNTFKEVSNLWMPDDQFAKTNEMLGYVEKAQPLIINYSNLAQFMDAKNTAIHLVVPGINGGTYSLDLGRYDYFSNSFKVHTLGAGNKEEVFDYTPGLYYSGVVNGIPGSVAAISFFKNEVYGVFSIPGEGNYVLVPNTMMGNSYDYNEHYVLYNDNDLKIKHLAPGCAADELKDPVEAAGKTTTWLNNMVYNSCTQVKIYEVCDYAMYLARGSNVTNVTNYITALFNNKATIYRNEGVPIVINHLQVNTATDAYQSISTASSSRFLTMFGWVTKNVLYGSDCAVLYSTRYGSMGGVAWLRALCSSYRSSDSGGAYGFCNINNSTLVNFPTYSWNVEVSTHELGHIVGSPHTHRCCWNPPLRRTAIDGCYTIEGTCADPGDPLPSVGGTIMSYCHLTSTGINFSNGFGIQPGDTVRRYIRTRFSSTCGGIYNPTTALSSARRTISANRECTDIAGGDTTTYFWADRNTAALNDDTLVLILKKHNNKIGTLDSAGFSVITGTTARYGSGKGDTLVFPSGVLGVSDKNYSMNRYWKINATSAPTSAVDVLFPFTTADSTDVDGSVPGVAPIGNFRMYRVADPIDPNPEMNFASSIASNFSIYTNGSTATTNKWALQTIGGTRFARMKMTSLTSGGSGFYAYGSVTSLDQVIDNQTQVYAYPNPTENLWYVTVAEGNGEQLQFQLFATDGKLVGTQEIGSGTVNQIDATNLAPGMYFYRIIAANNVFTGNLQRR